MTEKTPNQVICDSYNRNGYCIISDLLSKSEIERVVADFDLILKSQIEFVSGGKSISEGQSIFELMKKLFSLDRGRYLSTLKLAAKLYSLQKMMMNQAVAGAVRNLGIALPVIQARTVFHVMSNELRFEDGYFGFEVHQDWPSLQGSLDMITAWVPLVDVAEDLFTIEMLPGSHLRGLYPGEITSNLLEVDPAIYDSNAFIPIEARKGDVVLMSAFTLHRSSKKGRANDVRLAATCRYENALEASFIEHGYPFCQETTVKRELIFPDFPSAEQVRRLYE